jgi:hypothetical protein
MTGDPLELNAQGDDMRDVGAFVVNSGFKVRVDV